MLWEKTGLLSVIALIFFTLGLALLPLQAQRAAFTWQGENFLLNGKPFVIRSGEMHYPRVPRSRWRDRFRQARAMGLNTITTYVFWNLHEPAPGRFDFTGNLDVAEFVRQAGREGLYVIVRPGPYICTEWDFGGFPAWLWKTPEMKVRGADERFLAASRRYMLEVGKQLAPLQITNGGPLLMAQVENEYGSFGKDRVYMNAVRQMIVEAGFNVQLFTSDGSADYMLAGGTLPDLPAVINFGGGWDDAPKEFENFAKFRQNVPKMCGEFWVGWFDHWGEKHHTVPPEYAAKGVEWMLSRGISFNLYMFHGGTTFGFMAGANFSNKEGYQPDTSSYDYDSPLDEAGRPTPKFYALREVIKKYLPAGEKLPELPAPPRMIEVPRFELTERASFIPLLKQFTRAMRPPAMEEIGQNYGFLLYRAGFNPAAGKLEVGEIRDYAVIYGHAGGREQILGTLDRRRKERTLEINAPVNRLNILVENMGRINFGPKLTDDRKGLFGPVTFNGAELNQWEVYPVPLNDLSALRWSRSKPTGPFHRGAFDLKEVGDTFLDTRGWGKGHIWVNGHHLGRYWKIGPQQTLFVPAEWLRKGKNQVIALDLEEGGARALQGRRDPVFETP
jgi:beta-galactosidase